MLQIYSAPLQGFTTVFHRVAFHQSIGGIDKFFTPFFEKGRKRPFDPRLLPEIDPSLNQGLALVPQVIAADIQFFKTFCEEVSQLGYREVNLNVGCPYPPLVKRGMGGGMLSHPDMLARLLDHFYTEFPEMSLSVKMRTGIEEHQEWHQIMPVLNQFPLTEVIVHPRSVKQQYKGSPNWTAFGELMAECRHPLVANGDITSVEEYVRLQALFPSVERWMVGRGWLMNPFLPMEIKGSNFNDERLLKIKEFHTQFMELIATHVDDVNVKRNVVLGFWSYLAESFVNGHRHFRQLRLKWPVKDYQSWVNELYERAWIKA
jgi:tRNA-dihydrouridine synthase